MQSSALCRGLSCLPKLSAVGLSEDASPLKWCSFILIARAGILRDCCSLHQSNANNSNLAYMIGTQYLLFPLYSFGFHVFQIYSIDLHGKMWPGAGRSASCVQRVCFSTWDRTDGSRGNWSAWVCLTSPPAPER